MLLLRQRSLGLLIAKDNLPSLQLRGIRVFQLIKAAVVILWISRMLVVFPGKFGQFWLPSRSRFGGGF